MYARLVRLVLMVLKLEEVRLTADRKGKARAALVRTSALKTWNTFVNLELKHTTSSSTDLARMQEVH